MLSVAALQVRLAAIGWPAEQPQPGLRQLLVHQAERAEQRLHVFDRDQGREC